MRCVETFTRSDASVAAMAVPVASTNAGKDVTLDAGDKGSGMSNGLASSNKQLERELAAAMQDMPLSPSVASVRPVPAPHCQMVGA